MFGTFVAGLAQLVEQLIRNEQVVSSSLTVGSSEIDAPQFVAGLL